MSTKFYFLPNSLMANPAPKIIRRKAAPQNTTIETPTSGVRANPDSGIKEFMRNLP